MRALVEQEVVVAVVMVERWAHRLDEAAAKFHGKCKFSRRIEGRRKCSKWRNERDSFFLSFCHLVALDFIQQDHDHD